MKALWLKPWKPKNISTGRYQIAEKLEEKGVKSEFIEVSGKRFIPGFMKALTSDCEIIFGVVRSGLIMAYLVSKIKRKPWIADVSDDIEFYLRKKSLKRKLIAKLESFCVKRADYIITCFEDYQISTNPKKTEMIDYGVNFDLIAKPNKKIINKTKSILEKNNIKKEKPIVFYMGGNGSIYNLDKLINSAKKIKKAEYVFIGQKPEQNMEKIDNTHYLGSFEHKFVPGFLYHADICVCLVDVKRALKILEYGAAGKPVIALKGHLEKRFSGKMFFIENNQEELEKTINFLINNPEERRKMGEKLKEESKKFDWNIVKEKYYKIIKKVVK